MSEFAENSGCRCGCVCCGGGEPRSREEQVAELHEVKDKIERLLGELEEA